MGGNVGRTMGNVGWTMGNVGWTGGTRDRREGTRGGWGEHGANETEQGADEWEQGVDGGEQGADDEERGADGRRTSGRADRADERRTCGWGAKVRPLGNPFVCLPRLYFQKIAYEFFLVESYLFSIQRVSSPRLQFMALEKATVALG